MRRVRAGVVGVVMALAATACGAPAETTAAESSNAAVAGLPQLVGDTVRGAQLDTNDLAGQDVVVWFWAPW